MKAAIVQQAGQSPIYGDFANPTPSPGENRIQVTAAALSPLVRGRASGRHYSSSGQFPFVVGVDGVGRLDDGSRIYFILPKAPNGGMAEQTVVREEQCLPVPDGLDDVTAAAIANPGMSSWAAFSERAKLVSGETVLINGATGTSGRLAVQIARHFGAKKIIATGRNLEALRSLADLGADVTIPLIEDGAALEERFKEQFAARVDVVIDYLWGKSAERLLAAAAEASEEGARLRYVHVGAASGAEIALPGAVLRLIRHRADGQRPRQRPARPARSLHPRSAAGGRSRRFQNRLRARAFVRSRTSVAQGRQHAPHRVHLVTKLPRAPAGQAPGGGL